MFQFKSYSQSDPVWKNRLLGFDNQLTIGKYGCLLTCMAMVADGFGFNETPDTMNEKLKALGPNVGFQGALVIPSSLPRALPGMVHRKFIWCRESSAPMGEINTALAGGKPVIVELDYSPAPGLQNHWVVLYGMKDGDYSMRDPWPHPVESGEVLLGKSRFAFAGGHEQIITAALWMDGPEPLPSVPEPEDPDVLKVYAAVDGLGLRVQPHISTENLIKRLPLLARLSVLEPKEIAQTKIGVVNQWLKVRDSSRVEGYTAAWYVSLKRKPLEQPEPTPELPPAPAPAPDPSRGDQLIVQATVDGLALRSQPVVSADTLIKRLPFDAELLVLEGAESALKKVGVLDQWLKVQDIERTQGFTAAWYTSTNKQPPLGPRPEPASLIVRATADGLALRSQPIIADHTLIRRLPINAELVVLDPPAEAYPRIGITGQWLKVRSIDGAEGFVAAWYVALRPVAQGQ